MSASLVGSGSCDAAVATARAMTTGTGKSLITTTSCAQSNSFQEARCKVTRAAQASEAQKTGASDSIAPNLDVMSPPGAHRPDGSSPNVFAIGVRPAVPGLLKLALRGHRSDRATDKVRRLAYSKAARRSVPAALNRKGGTSPARRGGHHDEGTNACLAFAGVGNGCMGRGARP